MNKLKALQLKRNNALKDLNTLDPTFSLSAYNKRLNHYLLYDEALKRFIGM